MEEQPITVSGAIHEKAHVLYLPIKRRSEQPLNKEHKASDAQCSPESAVHAAGRRRR